MADQAVSSPCGSCGSPVFPGEQECPRCGIRLIDITDHHWSHAAKERVLDTLDAAGERARELWDQPAARQLAGGLVAAGAVIGLAAIGRRLTGKRED